MLNEKDVIDIIKGIGIDINTNKISREVTLASIGIDSLDIFNILVELEEKTGQKVPDEDVDKLTTINSIVQYFS